LLAAENLATISLIPLYVATHRALGGGWIAR
jgi:hypothetical protein